ncbi:MAG TPA: hypothetical protein VFU89_05700 [Rhabdochlamydiaceae bacterium]|nr:hypothetical protein [Rhabdochlamydiaceae bacterium]
MAEKRKFRACHQLILQAFRKLLGIFAMARALLLIQVYTQGTSKFGFDCASIPTFAAASIDHVQAHGLLPRRLRLLQIWGASFVKNQLLKFLGYIFARAIRTKLCFVLAKLPQNLSEILGGSIDNTP